MTQLINKKINVHKFGGSSLASVNRLNNVVDIIRQETQPQDFIVVSANGNVTDLLVDYSNGELQALTQIKGYYQSLVPQLLENSSRWLEYFNDSVDTLVNSDLTNEAILAHGELWSAKLLVALLNKKTIAAEFVDARHIFKTDFIENYQSFDRGYFNHGIANVQENNLKKRFIVTGFIAKNLAGKTITLGRNGSDYSASLLASLANADSVNLWTDVNGIYSADPRLISQAHKIDFLSYDEARALASIGTNVLHQKTISPLREQKIPLNIRSSFEPSGHGSCIGVIINHDGENALIENQNEVKSIALKEDLVELVLKESYDFYTQELQHEIFEKHINASIQLQKENHAQLILLVTKAQLELMEKILKQKQVKYHLLNDNVSLIAIVGLTEQENNKLSHGLLTSFSEEIQDYCSFSQQERVLNLLIKDIDAKNLLSQVYKFCFKAKLSPLRDCNSN